jgi:predicted O-methyltransferase YrrM
MIKDLIARSKHVAARPARLAARSVRLAQLVAVRIAASAAEAMRRKAKELEIRLDGLHKGLDVKPVSDIPAPAIDLASCDNPIAAIMASPEFDAATAFFADNPAAARSLLLPQAQALLYCLVRNLRPEHVFEIGAYKAGTTEAICRALHANAQGLAHTVDPFRGEYVAAVLKFWPPQLFRHVRLHATDSMAFYKEMERQGVQTGLVLVDGNHDYEFAAFDIACGARAIAPGGFIFIDNIAQPGPFFAARDFLSANPGWRELGSSTRDYTPDKAFDRHRTTIINTDFMVLQAPTTHRVDERPRNFGLIRWWRSGVNGVYLKLVPPGGPGVLSVQVVLRGFGSLPAETLAETTMQLAPGMSDLSVAFTPSAQLTGQFVYYTVEPWLIWRGAEPLQLVQPPEPY